ncbi:MAG: transposase [Archaeoglobus sp.]|uniref:transposase n=1 Tax=Archaeoglobus sp. TaxID=1872626 RepID=UPI001D8BF753|nr:transposase [Archaeoglobus sp.]MBO8180428.1 transposase [Archaeoglobus sp.]
MKLPVIVEFRDGKFKILRKIVKKLEKDEVKVALARNRIKPVDESVVMLKILLASLFFKLELSYFVEELKKRHKLRKLLNLSEVPDIKEVYDFMAKFGEESFRKAIEQIINSLFGKIGRGCFEIVIDTSGIDLDLNKQKHRKPNEELKDKEYKWGFDGNEFFLGFKLAFAMDYKTKRPLLFLIFPANTSDCQIYEDVLEDLKRRSFLKPKTIVMADKGFCSYYNYNVALKKYRVVSVIWLKENMSMSKLLSMISTPLTYFLENKIKDIIYFKKLVKILVSYLKRGDELKSKRSDVEDLFKLGKRGLFMDKIHRFTRRSVAKFVYANVLLIAILTRLGFREKRALQRLAEW